MAFPELECCLRHAASACRIVGDATSEVTFSAPHLTVQFLALEADSVCASSASSAMAVEV